MKVVYAAKKLRKTVRQNRQKDVLQQRTAGKIRYQNAGNLPERRRSMAVNKKGCGLVKSKAVRMIRNS